MTPPIARGVLTSQLVAMLVADLADEEGEDILVGRGQAPKDGGWPAGQPGRGTFAAYVTVKTGEATPAANQRDPLGVDNASWSVPYRLTSVGVNDSQVDDVADKVRQAVGTWPGLLEQGAGYLDLRGVHWSLQRVQYVGLGGSSPNNQTDPPFWEITDTVALWLSRSRA